MSYRDYLIWTASHTAASLSEAVRIAIDMGDDEDFAVRHLEHKLDVARELAKYGNYNSDRVEPRPATTEPEMEGR